MHNPFSRLAQIILFAAPSIDVDAKFLRETPRESRRRSRKRMAIPNLGICHVDS